MCNSKKEQEARGLIRSLTGKKNKPHLSDLPIANIVF